MAVSKLFGCFSLCAVMATPAIDHADKVVNPWYPVDCEHHREGHEFACQFAR